MTWVARTVIALSVLCVVSCCVGCGTSRVVTNDPSANIWANGKLIGRGQASLEQRGMSEETLISVRTDDGRTQNILAKRSMTAFTVLAGLFSYGLCFVFCWEYPDTIFALLPPAGAAVPAAPAAPVDPWLSPPADWSAVYRTAPPQPVPPVPEPDQTFAR